MSGAICSNCARPVDPAEADLWVVTKQEGPRQTCGERCGATLYTAYRRPEPDPYAPLRPSSGRHEALSVLFGYPPVDAGRAVGAAVRPSNGLTGAAGMRGPADDTEAQRGAEEENAA